MNLTDRQVRRLYDSIDASGDCWQWTGPTRHGDHDGERGWFSYAYTWRPATRVVWNHLVGPIAAGLQLDHLCRNTLCVNPDHLEPVTVAENVRRGYSPSAINARRSRCQRGHRFDADNTYGHPGGYRLCRTCQRDSQRRFREAGVVTVRIVTTLAELTVALGSAVPFFFIDPSVRRVAGWEAPSKEQPC